MLNADSGQRIAACCVRLDFESLLAERRGAGARDGGGDSLPEVLPSLELVEPRRLLAAATDSSDIVLFAVDDDGYRVREPSGEIHRLRLDSWFVSSDRRWRCRPRASPATTLISANPDGLAIDIEITNGSDGRGRRVRLTPGTSSVTIGRSPVEADVVVTDRKISARHARFTFEQSSCIVSDLGSRNGVSVNGCRVRGVAKVGVGDVVELGLTRIRLLDPGHELSAGLPASVTRAELPSEVAAAVRPPIAGDIVLTRNDSDGPPLEESVAGSKGARSVPDRADDREAREDRTRWHLLVAAIVVILALAAGAVVLF